MMNEFEITNLEAINIMSNVLPRPDIYGIVSKPRMVKSLGARDGIRTPWRIKTSVFRLYKPDSPEILMQCFEFDWY